MFQLPLKQLIKSQKHFWIAGVWKQYRIWRGSVPYCLRGLLNKHFCLQNCWRTFTSSNGTVFYSRWAQLGSYPSLKLTIERHQCQKKKYKGGIWLCRIPHEYKFKSPNHMLISQDNLRVSESKGILKIIWSNSHFTDEDSIKSIFLCKIIRNKQLFKIWILTDRLHSIMVTELQILMEKTSIRTQMFDSRCCS